MEGINEGIPIVRPRVNIGIEFFGVVATIALDKSEQVYLIAKIGFKAITIGLGLSY